MQRLSQQRNEHWQQRQREREQRQQQREREREDRAARVGRAPRTRLLEGRLRPEGARAGRNGHLHACSHSACCCAQ